MNRLIELYSRISKDIDCSLLEKMVEAVFLEYGNPNRYYHTISHIKRSLEQMDAYRLSSLIVTGYSSFFTHDTFDYDILEYAIWYHDIVMTGDGKSEELSAKRARLDGEQLDLNPNFIEMVEQLILMTKPNAQPMTNVDKVMIDIDLSILGSDRETYTEYVKGIREEYNDVNELDFCKGRYEFLKNEFMCKPFIYRTSNFQRYFEKTAQLNILDEVNMLKRRIEELR